MIRKTLPLGAKSRLKPYNTGPLLNNNAQNSHLFDYTAQDTLCANDSQSKEMNGMSKVFTLSAIAAAALIVATQTAFAKPALKDVSYISNSFVQFGIADEIRKNCDSIRPRMLRVVSFVNGLKSHAEGLGYTETEIDAYVDNDAEKKRLLGLAYTYMQANGVVKGQSETFCALGRAEIAKNSAAGRLLRAQ